MKIIIIGAGSGKRISKYFNRTPKSLLDINGKTILENQITLFKKNGFNDIFVITGSYKKKFNVKGINYVNDSNFHEHDILGSLMVAREYITNEVLITYSDIIFEESILLEVVRAKADIGITIDLDWEKHYRNRTEHPKSEAENVLLEDNRVLEIRKNIQYNNKKIGEFLGIVKLSSIGSKVFVSKYEKLEKSHIGEFHTAPSLNKAYLTDMIQELIDSKIHVTPIFISGKWCEIDTLQDLKNARMLFSRS